MRPTAPSILLLGLLGCGPGSAPEPSPEATRAGARGKADADDDTRLPFYFSSQARLYGLTPGPGGLEVAGCGPKTALFDRVRRVCVTEPAGTIVPCGPNLRLMELVELPEAMTCEGKTLPAGSQYLADVLAVSPLIERVTPRERVDLYDRDLHRVACANAGDTGFKVDETYPLERGADGRNHPRLLPSGEPFGHMEGVVFLEARSCDGQPLQQRRPYYVRKALVDIVSPGWAVDPAMPAWSDLRASGTGCPDGSGLVSAGYQLSAVMPSLELVRQEGSEPAEQARECVFEATLAIPAGYRLASLTASMSASFQLGDGVTGRVTAEVTAAGAFEPITLALERTGAVSEAYASAGSTPREVAGCQGVRVALRGHVRGSVAATVPADPPGGPGTFVLDVSSADLWAMTERCAD